jgi:hypothetical protein
MPVQMDPYTPPPPGGGSSATQRQLEGSTGTSLDGYLSQTQMQAAQALGIDLGYVFMGTQNVPGPNVRVPREAANVGGWAPTTLKQDKILNQDQALNLLYTDPQMRKKIAAKLIDAGLLSPDYTDQDLFTAWSQMVTRAKSLYAQGNRVSPFDVMAVAGGSPGQAGGGGPQTVTQSQVYLSSADSARSLLRSLISPWIGRQATEKEIDDFQAALNAAQRKNPTVTTTRTDATGEVISGTTREGVNPQAFAQGYLEDTFGGEHGDYDEVARLMPAFYQAIESPV